MFFTKKTPHPSIDLSWLKTDIHSHLLPGIDDGSQDMETSLQLIKGMVELGYQKLVTTPHVLWEIYPNTEEDIKLRLEELRLAVKQAGIKVELDAAAEYFIDDHFEEQLKNNIPFLPLRYKMILVEISMVTAPLDLQQVLFDMQIQGYQPVIAHPERYIYLTRKKEFFDELKDAGCFFQLNLLSLTGHYGRSVQELAEYLIGRKYYNFAGTDLHNERHLQALQKLGSSASYKRLRDSGILKNNVL
jgi:protein-tyrosine phosphatase